MEVSAFRSLSVFLALSDVLRICVCDICMYRHVHELTHHRQLDGPLCKKQFHRAGFAIEQHCKPSCQKQTPHRNAPLYIEFCIEDSNAVMAP